MKWSLKEDSIVCKFYLAHIDSWRDSLDSLMEQLRELGFGARDKGSVRMRIQNYAHLHTGSGLANVAAQSKTVYKVFTQRIKYPAVYSNLKVYIQDNYIPQGSNSGNDNIIGTPQTAANFIYTEPLGPTFQDVLFGFIDQRGMKDSEVYNACLVGRDTFSHIRKGDKGVSKRTVKQLCFGLKLTYDEAVVLMESAGYAFSKSNLADVIVEYYLKNSIYDIDDANITLYENQAELLYSEKKYDKEKASDQ